MVERQEVEEILESALRITGSPDVDNETLAALCRAWLAVQDAPEVWVSESAVKGEGWQMFGADGFGVTLPFEDTQRVRIVKEVGE